MNKQEFQQLPPSVKPFVFHGVELEPSSGGQWVGPSPFADGSRRKFFVDAESGRWDCKKSGQQGNVATFLTKYAELRHEETSAAAYKELSRDRGLSVKSLRDAGICFDPQGNFGEAWLVPCRAASGFVRDLRRYRIGHKVLASTPKTEGLGAFPFWTEHLTEHKGVVWLCEGEWDAIAMNWLLRRADRDDVAVSMPGAGVFKERWAELFNGRDIVIAYDSDGPGRAGLEKAAERLSGVAKRVRAVRWPKGTPEGFDCKDFVTQETRNLKAPAAVRRLLKLLEPMGGRPGTSGKGTPEKAATGRTATFKELEAAFEKWAYLTPDLRLGLKIVATIMKLPDVGGPPVWVYIVGQPSGGKGLLLDSWRHDERTVFVSQCTPKALVSGWKGKDQSILKEEIIDGKCLVLKDLTEVLTMPQHDQQTIFSTLRGAYDGYVDSFKGNAEVRVYEYERPFGMVAGVTSAIHAHSTAALGERALKFQLPSLTHEQERAINLKVRETEDHDAERTAELREVVNAFSAVELPHPLPKIPEEIGDQIDKLVQFVARVRAQVTRNMFTGELLFRPEHESGARLAKQLRKLVRGCAAIEGNDLVDWEDYAVAERVSRDTAYGFHLDIIDALAKSGGELTFKDLSQISRIPKTTLERRMQDLEALGAVHVTKQSEGMTRGRGRPPKLYCLNEEIMSLQDSLTERPKVTKKKVRKKKKKVRKLKRRIS